MRDASVPKEKIASVLRLLAHAAALDGVGTLAELALLVAEQAAKEEE